MFEILELDLRLAPFSSGTWAGNTIRFFTALQSKITTALLYATTQRTPSVPCSLLFPEARCPNINLTWPISSLKYSFRHRLLPFVRPNRLHHQTFISVLLQKYTFDIHIQIQTSGQGTIVIMNTGEMQNYPPTTLAGWIGVSLSESADLTVQ